MPLLNFSHIVRVAMISAMLVLVARAQDGSLEALVANSPFAPVQGAATRVGADVQPLEFRGVFADQGEFFFSIFDTATHNSLWAPLNEPGNSFTVRSYDPDKQSIVADYKGRNLTLSLKKGPITATVPDPTLPAQVNADQAPAVTANSSEEATRLAAVAAEIRRRRSMRQQLAPTSIPGLSPANPKTP